MMNINLSRNYVRVLNLIGGQLPELTGTIKQKAWAYRIRDYYIEHCKFNVSVIKRCTLCSYWVENKERLIGDVVLSPVKLPTLKGDKADVINAYPVRENFANRFPDVDFLRSQTDASFWINNADFLDKLFDTNLVMDKDADNPPIPTADNVDNINLNHYPGISPLQANTIADALLSKIA